MQIHTVLFVDDEPSILSSMRRLFHDDRLNLLTASSAEEAIEIMRSRSVAVLVTDNLMPGITGVELVRKVKDVSPNTIRILLSGFSDMDAVLHAVNEGEVFRFLLKPWADPELKATVHLALAHFHLLEQNLQLSTTTSELWSFIDALKDKYPTIFDELAQSLCCESLVSNRNERTGKRAEEAEVK